MISEALAGRLYPDNPNLDSGVHRLFANTCYYSAGLNGLAVKHYRRALDLQPREPKEE